MCVCVPEPGAREPAYLAPRPQGIPLTASLYNNLSLLQPLSMTASLTPALLTASLTPASLRASLTGGYLAPRPQGKPLSPVIVTLRA